MSTDILSKLCTFQLISIIFFQTGCPSSERSKKAMPVLCSQRPFGPGLLRNMKSILDLASYLNDLTLIGQDGQFAYSGFLIGAISPLLQSLEKSQTMTVPAVIMLPDFTRAQIATFFSHLTSDSGPKTIEDQILFKSLLSLLGQTDNYQLETTKDDSKSELDDEDTLPLAEIDAQGSPEPVQLPKIQKIKIPSQRKKIFKGKYII